MRRSGLAIAFVGLLAIQVTPSLHLAWQQTERLNGGRPVRLAVETRDPRDLLRGEYSVLAYEIGRLQGVGAGTQPRDCDLETRESCRLETGRVVYLRLSADAEGIHRAEEVLFEPPDEGALFIKGRVGSATVVRQGAPLGTRTRSGRIDGQPSDLAACQRPACLTGTVSYGIEQWYGPQGVPAKLDRTARKDVLVEVRLAADGRAAIDGITVAGGTLARTARLW